MNNQDYNLKEDVFKWLGAYGLKQGDKKMHWPSIKFFHDEVKEYMDASSKRDEIGTLLEFVDIAWQIENMLYYGIEESRRQVVQEYSLLVLQLSLTERDEIFDFSTKIKRAFKAVSEANWSKLCKTEGVAEHSVYLYRIGEHPQKMGHKIETYWEKIGDYYVVKTPEGKGMKSYLSRNPRDIYNELLKKHMEDGSNI